MYNVPNCNWIVIECNWNFCILKILSLYFDCHMINSYELNYPLKNSLVGNSMAEYTQRGGYYLKIIALILKPVLVLLLLLKGGLNSNKDCT